MSVLSTLSFERKAVLALFAVTVLLAAVAMTAVASLVGIMIDQRRTLADMQAAVATTDGTAAPKPALGQAAKRLFPARNASEFQSALQSFVKDVAARHQGVIESIQVLKSERVGGLSRVVLKLDGLVPEPRLGALLADLATGEPLVLLQAMELRPAIVQQNRIDNGGTPADAVQVRLDVVAYSAMTPQSLGGQK
ncbi:MAG: type II secretion system protein M [Hyphomicrobiaceae bacterium]|nr:type II secretion system protein M [Hyphomicrobiaceae bacterium]